MRRHRAYSSLKQALAARKRQLPGSGERQAKAAGERFIRTRNPGADLVLRELSLSADEQRRRIRDP
jgi:hypothetical protein